VIFSIIFILIYALFFKAAFRSAAVEKGIVMKTDFSKLLSKVLFALKRQNH
jgi:hypothetical protein